MLYDDTIAAIATPPGEGGLGIVRLSGPEALAILQHMFMPFRAGRWRPYRMRYGHVVAADGAPIDEALAVYMRAPHSFTAEDTAEISCHGGPLVLSQVFALALAHGARAATPGEFTLRAFANGRIDLTQAEATLDVIQAKTAAGLGCTALSLVAAAHNLRGFATVPLRAGPTLLAQLAIGFVRTFMPSAVTTPAVASRYLNRRGAPWPAALGSVSAAQLAQLVVTTLIVGTLSVTSSGAGLLHVRPAVIAVGAAGAAALVGVVALLARRSSRVRCARHGVATSWTALREHARRHPGRIAVGVLAAGALTATHVLAFVCCVYAVGGHGPLLALSIVYLGSSAAGSLIPTPGGTGAVEAALIAGLTATGLPLPVAATAALLSRLESVWLPALPGWWALRVLRRDGSL